MYLGKQSLGHGAIMRTKWQEVNWLDYFVEQPKSLKESILTPPSGIKVGWGKALLVNANFITMQA